MVIQACMNKVIDMLDRALQLFWEAVQTVCLDNKLVAVVNGEIQPGNSNASGALRVKTARYDVQTKSIEMVVQGRTQPIIGKCP